MSGAEDPFSPYTCEYGPLEEGGREVFWPARRKEDSSWKEFMEWAARDGSDARYRYRGQSNRVYQLVPTLFRPYKDRTNEDAENRRKIFHEFHGKRLEKFKELYRRTRTDIPGNAAWSAASWISLAQHYKMHTPLLDWSASPYIAAFIAYAAATKRDTTSDLTDIGKTMTDHQSSEPTNTDTTSSPAEKQDKRIQEISINVSKLLDEDITDHLRGIINLGGPIDDEIQKYADLVLFLEEENEPKYIRIFRMDLLKRHHRVVVLDPPHAFENPRIHAQKGCFSYVMEDEATLASDGRLSSDFIESMNILDEEPQVGDYISFIDLPINDMGKTSGGAEGAISARRAIENMENMNISLASLFPDSFDVAVQGLGDAIFKESIKF